MNTANPLNNQHEIDHTPRIKNFEVYLVYVYRVLVSPNRFWFAPDFRSFLSTWGSAAVFCCRFRRLCCSSSLSWLVQRSHTLLSVVAPCGNVFDSQRYQHSTCLSQRRPTIKSYAPSSPLRPPKVAKLEADAVADADLRVSTATQEADRKVAEVTAEASREVAEAVETAGRKVSDASDDANRRVSSAVERAAEKEKEAERTLSEAQEVVICLLFQYALVSCASCSCRVVSCCVAWCCIFILYCLVLCFCFPFFF